MKRLTAADLQISENCKRGKLYSVTLPLASPGCEREPGSTSGRVTLYKRTEALRLRRAHPRLTTMLLMCCCVFRGEAEGGAGGAFARVAVPERHLNDTLFWI